MKDYISHWVLGVICTVVWFWGDKAGIPSQAQLLAASIVPGLLAHALGYASGVSNGVVQAQAQAQTQTLQTAASPVPAAQQGASQ